MSVNLDVLVFLPNTLVLIHMCLCMYINPKIEFPHNLKYSMKTRMLFSKTHYILRHTCPVQSFPCGLAGKESTCKTRDLGLIPGLGRFPGEGKGYPLQYSGPENSMDCLVHGVSKSQARLNNFHLLSCLIERKDLLFKFQNK